MQVTEVARKHGVPVQRVLNLLEESGIQGKEAASALTEVEVRHVESRLGPAMPKKTVVMGQNVKVLRPSSSTPIVRRPVVPEKAAVASKAPSTAAAGEKSATGRAAATKEGAVADRTTELRRVGVESKARDLMRAKRMRESGFKPRVATPPVPEPAPAPPVVEETMPPPVEAKPAPGPAEDPNLVSKPTPASERGSVPASTEGEGKRPAASGAPPSQSRTDQPRRRPPQSGGGRDQGGRDQRRDSHPRDGQRPPQGGGGPRPQDSRRPPQQGGRRPSRDAGGATRPKEQTPAVAPVAPDASAVAGAPKRTRGRKAKIEEITETRKDRESTVVERKVLSSFQGRKRGKSQKYKRSKRERMAASQEAQREKDEKERTTLRIHEATTVADVAHGLGVNSSEILKILLDLGKVLTVNQHLDRETIDLIADEFGFEVEETSLMDVNPFEEFDQVDDPDKLLPRPPVVTVMGHVDHGKTKLMDAIRSADVASGEAGGITQHIGAYYVTLGSGKTMTFIDTPGHEAFTAMRARGAMVTDVVVLVVAANDGVMPQTREAIAHAKAAGVPILVAVNKIDAQGANIERVKNQLAEEGLVPEDWGGKTPVAEISALKKVGIDSLVDLIHLQAELLELKANPDKHAKGTIIEARLEQGRGPVATVLIQEGTLHVGDPIVAGVFSGKVRALMNEHGSAIKEATPGVPVAILGLSGTPVAGDELRGVPDEKTARELGNKLQQIRREREMADIAHVSLESLFHRIEEGSVKDLNIIVKGDVQGSVEAVSESLGRIESEKVKVRILHRGVGSVSESDIMLASASDAIILGFNVAIPGDVVSLQQRERVDVRTYSIIYDAIEDIKKAMLGLLADEVKEVVLGHLEVLEIFRSSKTGLVVGGRVTQGRIIKGRNARIIRDSRVITDAKITTLRRFKDDVNEVTEGLECGIGIANFQDLRQHDIIECYQMETFAATL